MNILIVDDQMSVLNGLLNGIHFSELGFSSVFTAMSTDEALKMLEKETVHILLTDVEMPGQNGLVLNSIVKEKYSDILRIVLTSHAVFSYAQTSLKLQCFDYLVQPAPFEDIEASLKKAVEAVQVNYNNRRISRYGHLFKNYESDFMGTIIQQLWYHDPEAVNNCIKLLNQSGHSVRPDSACQLIFVDVFSYTRQETGYPSQQLIMNAISRSLHCDPCFDAVDLLVSLNPHRCFSILLIDIGDGILPAAQNSVTGFYQSLCRELPGRSIACYYSDSFPFSEIHPAITAASEHIKNNITNEPMVSHILPAMQPGSLDLLLPEYLNHWSSLLYSNQRNLLKKEIDFCLDKKIPAVQNRFQSLYTLNQQIVQLFFKYFYENGIDINSIFTDDFTCRDCMDHCSTVDEVKRNAAFLLDAASRNADASPETNYVSKAKAYISDNIRRLILVKEVADYVHLNPEYFTKLFKKETGMNIKDYIVDCKIALAKDLLTTSNLPVNMVATEVGYSNFSHFTQIFKRAEHMTPSEYRLLFSKKS